MSQKRKNIVKEILIDLQEIVNNSSDKELLSKIEENRKDAFHQMCYYQGYQTRQDQLNMMQGEYEKFRGIYLCYNEPKIAMMSLQKGLLTTRAQKAIINHFLKSHATALFRQKSFFRNVNTVIHQNKKDNSR